MARKTITLTIADENRDKGKTFFGMEMPATDAEELGLRIFLLLARSGVEVPEDIQAAGLAGLVHFELQGLSGVNFDDAKPLLDRLMACWQIMPDPRHPNVKRALVADDVEEPRTLLQLKAEIFKLHVDFSAPADQSTSTSPSPSGSAGSEQPGTSPRVLPRSSRQSSPPMPTSPAS